MKKRNKKRAAIIIIIIIAFIISLMILIKKNKVIKKIEKFDMIIYPNAKNIKPILYKTLLFCNKEVQYNIRMKFPPKKIIEYYDKELEKRGYKIYIEKPYRDNIRRWIFASRSIDSDKHSARYYSYWTDKEKSVRVCLSLIYYWDSDDYRVGKPKTDELSVRFLVQSFKKFPVPRKQREKPRETIYRYKDGLYKIEAGRFEIRVEKDRKEDISDPENWEELEDLNGYQCIVSKKAIIETKDIYGIRIEKNDVFDEPYYHLEIISNKNVIEKNLSIFNNNLNKDLALVRFDKICGHLDNSIITKKIKYYNITEQEISCIIAGMVRVEKNKSKILPPEIRNR